MNVARAITHNFGAKVLALIVALLVWFNASGQEQVVRMRQAPLVIEGVADSLALASTVPASADLRITATRRQIIVLGFQRLVVAADLSGLGPGRQRLPLSGDDVRGIGGLEPGHVQVVSPAVLDVDLEPMETRRLQVSLETIGALPGNLLLLQDGVAIDPAWVTVRGPESQVVRFQHVSTEAIDLSKVRESGTREVDLNMPDASVSCQPKRVSVTIRVSPRGERVLANVPPTVLLDSGDVEALVEPKTVSLTLEGPSAVLDTLASDDVSVLLTVKGRAKGAYRMVPQVILPPGIRLATMSADTFDVQVVPASP